MSKFYVVIATVAVVTASIVSGCSTARTKWTDRTMRVMIDPDSIPASQHVALQQALVEQGKWFVVDRAVGYRAIKTEQERLHRTEEDRYEDREKWSHWGKMYGVGGIIVGAIQCKNQQSFWGNWYQTCNQFLSIVDANTGEVIAAIQTRKSSGDAEFVPEWDDAVDKLANAYPSHFNGVKTSERLEQYRTLSAEEAQRQREKVTGRSPAQSSNTVE